MLIKRKSIEKEESSRPASASASAAAKPARKPKYAPVTLSEFD
ncbi:spermidine synthase, partial [Pseudoxanthomonas sp. KAs_5_3]